MNRIFVFALTLMFGTCADAIVVSHQHDSEDAFAEPHRYPEVIALLDHRAVGTLIAPQWILTAAHVAEHMQQASVQVQGHERTVKQIVMHPSWDSEKVSSEGVPDIALLKLDEPVEAAVTAVLYSGAEELGKKIEIVGWGRTGNGLDGNLLRDKKMRRGFNLIEQVEPRIRFNFDTPAAEHFVFLEAVSGPGDSGGPGFMTLDNKRYLIGISSFQQDIIEPGIYGVTENYERVSGHLEWINAVINPTDTGQK